VSDKVSFTVSYMRYLGLIPCFMLRGAVHVYPMNCTPWSRLVSLGRLVSFEGSIVSKRASGPGYGNYSSFSTELPARTFRSPSPTDASDSLSKQVPLHGWGKNSLLRESDLEEKYAKGGGPGGQSVNKSANKVRLNAFQGLN
jgi:hypothetical protein